VKILIVDDSKAMRMIVLRTLRQAGIGDHEYSEAPNGADALKLVESGAFDLVLSDWNMPEMSGIELLRALRSVGSKVHFGFITSESNEDMKRTAIEAGARFLVTKPFTADDVKSALSGLVK
jgi:two-component system chemotaxis response regulator CheY